MDMRNDKESKELLLCQTHIWNHIFHFINSMSLKCAVQLDIPDIIKNHGGPMSLSEIVSALPINPSKSRCVYRLMRILVHSGFFTKEKISGTTEEEEGYLLTPASSLLLKDEPQSVRPFLLGVLDPISIKPWHNISEWFQNDDPTPFDTAHGRTFWDYMGHEPQISHSFNEGMASDALLVTSMVIKDCKGVFKGLNSLVDVGGGNGTLAKAIADAFPKLECTVLDLPHVVAGLQGSGNLKFVGGDMFQAIPSTDAVLLKCGLHDWSDQESIKILKRCKEAIPSKGGKVIIIDMKIENNDNGDAESIETQLFFDMQMMILVTGRERTEKEWAKLFVDAGFSGYKITPILGLRSLIEDEIQKQRAKTLEGEIRAIIGEKDANPLTTLELIDDIQRLGLNSHFDKDIKRALDRIFLSVNGPNVRTEQNSNIHAIALCFRLCRQHGYEVSQDLLQIFKDKNGNFMESLCKDTKGLLSLYEASYFSFEGENLMEEAKVFTTKHLKGYTKGEIVDKDLVDQINHALEMPMHHRMLRLEARWYIEAYGRRRDANYLLLEMAKLDFNMVQSILQGELKDMSRWWSDIGLGKKLSFIRDRLMECFFWTVGMVFEPKFSDCRKSLTKLAALVTTIDDVYDVYGSLDELELFTAAVNRWDIKAVETLPDYMKFCFLALYDTTNEMADGILKQKGVNIISYLTRAWADLCTTFLVEAKWRFNGEIPTFKAYLDNGVVSVSGVLISVHTYFLLTKTIAKEALECIEKKYHPLVECSSLIFRLSNDLATSKAELERGESANSIVCYMHETGLSEQEARTHISSLIDEAWKKMNKARIAADSPFEKPFIETTINLARIAKCTYQNGDGHGAPDNKAKDRVLSVIIKPIASIAKT